MSISALRAVCAKLLIVELGGVLEVSRRTGLLITSMSGYALGALVTTVLGMYSSVLGLIVTFSSGSVATSFSCASPA